MSWLMITKLGHKYKNKQGHGLNRKGHGNAVFDLAKRGFSPHWLRPWVEDFYFEEESSLQLC